MNDGSLQVHDLYSAFAYKTHEKIITTKIRTIKLDIMVEVLKVWLGCWLDLECAL